MTKYTVHYESVRDMNLPRFPEGLTPAWLNDVLHREGLIDDDTNVTQVTQVQVGDGTGMMSELMRLKLAYDREDAQGPRSLVAKYPSQNPTNREIAMSYNLYEREVRYFDELDPLTSAYSPATYYLQLHGDNFIILMEDMSEYRVGDQTQGADLDDTEHAIGALAQLHAAFWNDVEHLDWVPHIANSYHADNMATLVEVGWPNMCDAFHQHLDAGIAGRGKQFIAEIRQLQNLVNRPPMTLLHGDFRMENLFFATEPSHQPIAIIDWQGPLIGMGMVDVALFLGQSTQADVRREHERTLVARYVDALASEGVQDYDHKRAWADYKLALLYNWVYVGVVAGTLDSSNERAFQWMSQMVERQCAATLELDLFELID